MYSDGFTHMGAASSISDGAWPSRDKWAGEVSLGELQGWRAVEVGGAGSGHEPQSLRQRDGTEDTQPCGLVLAV